MNSSINSTLENIEVHGIGLNEDTFSLLGSDGNVIGLDLNKVTYYAAYPAEKTVFLRFDSGDDGSGEVSDPLIYEKIIPILEKKFGKPL